MKKIKVNNKLYYLDMRENEEELNYYLFSLKKEQIGRCVIYHNVIETFEDELHYLDDRLLEKLADILQDKYTAIDLNYLFIENEFRRQGFGRILIDCVLSDIQKDFDNSLIYLNASPMDRDKSNILQSDDLVEFYEKSGFVTYLDQGHNSQMFLTNKSQIHIVNNIKEIKKKKPNTIKI